MKVPERDERNSAARNIVREFGCPLSHTISQQKRNELVYFHVSFVVHRRGAGLKSFRWISFSRLGVMRYV